MDSKATIKNELDQVIESLQHLNIESSYNTLIRLVGCIRSLSIIRDEIDKLASKEEIQNVGTERPSDE